MVSTATTQKIGKTVQVIGSTFDVEFDEAHVPSGCRTIATEVRS